MGHKAKEGTEGGLVVMEGGERGSRPGQGERSEVTGQAEVGFNLS